jgi:type I restriction enzyme M protein
MVRIAQVNMYLHQFKNPQIFQYDSLTSEERWNDKFDVILANPPFMTPKGGIKPHNKFGINVNRSEVLFIDYILSHLKPNGKAGIIVPEGIVFQSSSAYKNLRKNLVNNGLYAVISLPSGVFQPYSGVKTNILLIDKEFSKSNTKILFITLNQLGISLGISNKIIEENDLPFAHSIIDSFLKGTSIEPTKNIFSIEKKVIEEFDFTLSSSVYRPEKEGVGDAQWRKLSEICTIEKGKSSSTKTEPGPYPLVLTAKSFKSASQFDFDGEGVAVPLISSTGHGKADITRVHFVNGKFALANLLAFVQPISLNILNPKYLYYMLNSHKKELASLMNGAANVSMNTKDLGTFSIPLPPLEVQEQIVTDLDGYAAIISGAKQIVENWKPAIDNSNNYELVELNQFCKIKNGYAFTSTDMGEFQDGSLPVVKIGNVGADGEIDTKFKFHTYSKKLDNFILVPGDIVIAMTGATVGKVATIPKGKFLLNQRVGKVEMTSTEVELDYVRFTLQSSTFYSYCQATATGGAQGNISAEEILKFKIPIAPMNVQLQLIEFVKKEKEQVESLRHLIESYETRSKSVISKLWSE